MRVSIYGAGGVMRPSLCCFLANCALERVPSSVQNGNSDCAVSDYSCEGVWMKGHKLLRTVLQQSECNITACYSYN